jgi:hypothetical protein
MMLICDDILQTRYSVFRIENSYFELKEIRGPLNTWSSYYKDHVFGPFLYLKSDDLCILFLLHINSFYRGYLLQ